MATATATVALADGATTTVERWGDAGPIVLCVHGIASSRAGWRRTGERLAGRFQVVAYDQRGHGDCAAVVGPMTLEQSVADLAAVAATLDEPIRGLLGHSWGGAVALLGGREIACARVIAVDPMIRQAAGMWAADFVDDLRELFARAPGEREPAIREMFAGAPPIEIDAKVHAMRSMRIAAIEALGSDNAADTGGWDLREALRDYPKPLYLAVADPGDSVISPGDLEFVRANAGPAVSIDVYTGEGHTLQRTAFERFAGACERFLASEPAVRAES